MSRKSGHHFSDKDKSASTRVLRRALRHSVNPERIPISGNRDALYLRRGAMAMILLMPSVTCCEESVAPEMLRMSLPTCSALAFDLPTNCASQLGLLISPP